MKYRIDYVGRHSEYAENREQLLCLLSLPDASCIVDVRKVYKTGATDSVMDKYKELIRKYREVDR